MKSSSLLITGVSVLGYNSVVKRSAVYLNEVYEKICIICDCCGIIEHNNRKLR
jgi:hypothetical protein